MADKELKVPVDENVVDTSNSQVVTPEEGIEDLKRKLQLSEAARLEAETRERAASERAQRASGQVEDTNLTLVKSGIERVNRDREVLKANYATAMANGDFTEAANIQEQMSDAAVHLQRLTEGKEAMEAQAKVPKPQPVAGDPVEALAKQLTPRSAAWVRAHPEYARDNRLYQKMLAAHNLVVSDGYEPDSDDYFNNVETLLGVKLPGETPLVDTPMSEASTATKTRTAPPPAAPAQRGGARSNVVRLTADELEVASMMGMAPEEYAKNKAELKAAGRLN